MPEILECIHGEPVEVELMYTSQEYRAVLPKDCIRYDTDGSPYIFQTYSRTRIFGTEYYVKKIYVDECGDIFSWNTDCGADIHEAVGYDGCYRDRGVGCEILKK